MAADIDLAGRDVNEAVKRGVDHKGIDCPTPPVCFAGGPGSHALSHQLFATSSFLQLMRELVSIFHSKDLQAGRAVDAMATTLSARG
jgi:hypothetical protein